MRNYIAIQDVFKTYTKGESTKSAVPAVLDRQCFPISYTEPMCGIIGIAGNEVDPKKRRAIELGSATLIRRGPDGSGLAQFPNAIFGHRRLSIIDISGGAQPMEDTTGNLVITFNGEIYNYRELKEKLKSAGHSFRTNSDTEVILESYRAYGYDCVSHLDGMFAFAIWDKKKQELFLARDRFGEKPLYYSETISGLLFASEIKALLATGLVEPKLDVISLDNYLSLSYIPPWRNVYTTIKPLLPAHYAVFKNGTLTTVRYWNLKRRHLNVSLSEAAETVKELLKKSVKSRLVADVEVGSFLSGGIDSSIVTALAQGAMAPRTIKTFSAGFENFINELPYAEQIANRYATEHHTTNINMDVAQALRSVTERLDEPFADSSVIPTHLLSEFARTHVKVALSGDGGDELFFGYGQYRAHLHMSLPRKILENLRDRLSNHPRHLMKFFSPRERQGLWRDPSCVESSLAPYLDLSEAETNLQKINLVDFQMTLPGDILAKVDRASMMYSLEVRVPFLQHELAEFAYNLPDEYKTDRNHGKIVLAQACVDYLPPEFFARKKQGFGAPIKKWLRKEEMRPLVDALAEPSARIYSLMRIEYIRPIVEQFSAGDDTLARRIWTLLTLELWLQAHPESQV